MHSLYERLGGDAAVEAAVTRFYDKVLADEALAPWFSDLDMARQIDKQISFMTMVFGGPNEYSGADLRTAHQGLVKRGLDDSHFDGIVGHLQATLRELGVDETVVNEVLQLVNGTRDDVLDR